MYSYIVRRLAFGAITVLGVSIVVFFVLRVLPGDPLVAIFGAEGYTKLSEAERAGYMAQLGLSDPLVVQYLRWVGDIASGSLGRSFFRAESVAEMMTAKVETCVAEDQADDVLTKMTQGRFRHLPVVEEGLMVGIISIGDVVKARLSELSMEKDALEGMITGR